MDNNNNGHTEERYTYSVSGEYTPPPHSNLPQPQYYYQPPFSPAPPAPQKQKKSNFTTLVFVLCLVCTLLAGSFGGVAGYLLFQDGNIPQETSELADLPSATPGATDTPLVSPEHPSTPITPVKNSDGLPALTVQEIFAAGDPSTVAIATQTTTNVFGQPVSQASAGSGFIISEDGYIITNYHVIDGATEMKAMLNDGTEYRATLVGGDEISDIAVLKIDAKGLKKVELGDSDSVSVGDQVVAIGNPLGELANTLTVGYVSAKERDINIDQYPRSMLQTDASVSPGNSGGPLFNIYGQVIGVVSAKTVASGVEGIGFAIPINEAADIATSLIEHGYVSGRPYVGIGYEEITQTISQFYNLPTGLYVTSVEPGSAAEAAGLAQGDVITKLDDYTIASAADMYAAKLEYKAGDTVTLTVVRGAEELKLTLTFGEQKPAEQTPSVPSQQYPGYGYPGQQRPAPEET